MKSKRLAAMLLVTLLLGSGIIGCKDKTVQEPPPVADNVPAPPAEVLPEITITESEAQAIVDERLSEGYRSAPSGETEAEGKAYYLFAVKDDADTEVGTVAIDKASGERFNYDGTNVSAYADFPLYDAKTDAVYSWNGVFTREDTSIELLQADANSFEFEFADGTTGVGRIKGDAAQTDDGELTFSFENETTLRVGGDNAALAGTYVKSEA